MIKNEFPAMGQGRKSLDEISKLWGENRALLDKVNADNLTAAAERETILKGQQAINERLTAIDERLKAVETAIVDVAALKGNAMSLNTALLQINNNQGILQGNIINLQEQINSLK